VYADAGAGAGAGADGIFVPGLAAADDIRSLTVLRDGKQGPAATPYWDMQARLVAFS
jgi:hypothetical protein